MRALALASLLLASPTLPAQTFQPFLGGNFYGQGIYSIDWQGKPGFLLVGKDYWNFASYQVHRWLPGKPQASACFNVVAAYFLDKRTCAPGSPVIITTNDHPFGNRLGALDSSGNLTWYGKIPIWNKSTLDNRLAWICSYCDYGCYGKCINLADGPEFSALVIVIRD